MPTYRDLKKLLKEAKATFKREGKGSHEIWELNGKTVSVPKHLNKEIPTGTYNSIKKWIKEALKG